MLKTIAALTVVSALGFSAVPASAHWHHWHHHHHHCWWHHGHRHCRWWW